MNVLKVTMQLNVNICGECFFMNFYIRCNVSDVINQQAGVGCFVRQLLRFIFRLGFHKWSTQRSLFHNEN